MSRNNQLANFNGQAIQVIYQNGDAWMTGEQIGDALGYEEPRIAISKIYKRNLEELNEYSCVTKMVTQGENGVMQQREVRLFNEEGVMLICMFSQQPRAREFRKWAVKILKAYRHGQLQLQATADKAEMLLAFGRMQRDLDRTQQELNHVRNGMDGIQEMLISHAISTTKSFTKQRRH